MLRPASEPPIGYKLRYQHPIIPPRIPARAGEAIEKARRHVGFWALFTGLTMSVFRGGPEAAFRGRQDRLDPERSLRRSVWG
jgi:hypothetical protein